MSYEDRCYFVVGILSLGFQKFKLSDSKDMRFYHKNYISNRLSVTITILDREVRSNLFKVLFVTDSLHFFCFREMLLGNHISRQVVHDKHIIERWLSPLVQRYYSLSSENPTIYKTKTAVLDVFNFPESIAHIVFPNDNKIMSV